MNTVNVVGALAQLLTFKSCTVIVYTVLVSDDTVTVAVVPVPLIL
jgi:hypothetical protein